MAYSWEVGSTPTFRALSYEDWAKPLREATEFHRDIEQQYADLDAQASVWEKLANDVRGKDSQAYKIYKNYADDLQSQADDFARHGLKYSSRKRMFDIRARYAKEIMPIDEAWKRKEEASRWEREMMLKNPNLRFMRHADEESIDAFLANPEWKAGAVDMKELYAKVAGEAGALKEQLIQNLEGITQIQKQKSEGKITEAEAEARQTQLLETENSGYLKYFIQHGLTPAEVQRQLASKDSFLSTLIMSDIMGSGIKDMEHGYYYDDADARQARFERNYQSIYDYLKGAAFASVGKTDVNFLKDEAKLLNNQIASSERIAAANRWMQWKIANAGNDKNKDATPYAKGYDPTYGDASAKETLLRLSAYNNIKKLNPGAEMTKAAYDKVIDQLVGTYGPIETIDFTNPLVQSEITKAISGLGEGESLAGKNIDWDSYNKEMDAIKAKYNLPDGAHSYGVQREIDKLTKQLREKYFGADIDLYDIAKSNRQTATKYGLDESTGYNGTGTDYGYMADFAREQANESVHSGNIITLNSSNDQAAIEKVKNILKTIPESETPVREVNNAGKTVDNKAMTIPELLAIMDQKKDSDGNGVQSIDFEIVDTDRLHNVIAVTGTDGKTRRFDIPLNAGNNKEEINLLFGNPGGQYNTGKDWEKSTASIVWRLADKSEKYYNKKDRKALVDAGLVQYTRASNGTLIPKTDANGKPIPMTRQQLQDFRKLFTQNYADNVVFGFNKGYQASRTHNDQYAKLYYTLAANTGYGS